MLSHWHTALSQFEFEYNSSKHTSTKLSPFQVDIGANPTTSFIRSFDDCKTQCQSSYDVLERQKAFSYIAQDNLKLAQTKRKVYAYKSRRLLRFQKGDWVFLKADTIRPSGFRSTSALPFKWRPKFLGPPETIEVLGQETSKIELPPSMKQNPLRLSRFQTETLHQTFSRNLGYTAFGASGARTSPMLSSGRCAPACAIEDQLRSRATAAARMVKLTASQIQDAEWKKSCSNTYAWARNLRQTKILYELFLLRDEVRSAGVFQNSETEMAGFFKLKSPALRKGNSLFVRIVSQWESVALPNGRLVPPQRIRN